MQTQMFSFVAPFPLESCSAMASVVMLGPNALALVVLPSCHQVIFPHTCQLKGSVCVILLGDDSVQCGMSCSCAQWGWQPSVCDVPGQHIVSMGGAVDMCAGPLSWVTHMIMSVLACAMLMDELQFKGSNPNPKYMV
ncbi:hypothetical protein EDC04DRAFT_2927611 [Pisolithus marmoratus]|nr:hypothetical protein EDC04DRAFT_2927611 [Pisolithus marmoratus]